MSASQLLFTANIVAILSALLLTVGYLKTEPKAPSAWVFAVTGFFIVLYLLEGMTDPTIDPNFRLKLEGWQAVRITAASAIPGLFMIYCFLIFQEHQRFPLPLALAFIVQMGVEVGVRTLGAVGWLDIQSRRMLPVFDGLSLMQVCFVGFAVYWTLSGWRADLVESRRLFRWLIIGMQGVLIFKVVLLEGFLLGGGPTTLFGTGRMIITYIGAAVGLMMVLVAMHFDYVSFGNVTRRAVKSGDGSEREKAAVFCKESFDKAFFDGQLYRKSGLTIALLSQKLEVPEYRLRTFIHKQLGFRNFNAMLHKYRIEDAAAALSDENNRSMPILTIALSVGYQSITPFNTAFRQIKGVTPSEFRKGAIG